MFNFWGCTTHWKCDTIINRGRCIYLQYFKLKGMQNDALESLSRDVCWTFKICWSDTWFWAFFNNLLNFKVIDNLNYHNFKFTRIKLNNDCVHEHISVMFVLSKFFLQKAHVDELWKAEKRSTTGAINGLSKRYLIGWCYLYMNCIFKCAFLFYFLCTQKVTMYIMCFKFNSR